jgi:hypothetical protein
MIPTKKIKNVKARDFKHVFGPETQNHKINENDCDTSLLVHETNIP